MVQGETRIATHGPHYGPRSATRSWAIATASKDFTSWGDFFHDD